MIRPSDRARAAAIDGALGTFSRAMPGLSSAAARDTFVAQLVESLRRIEYLAHISRRSVSPAFADPDSGIFDPLQAAVLHKATGNIDEAWWLVFLAAHFGRHRRTKWKLAADFYGQLGSGKRFDWHTTSSNPGDVQSWLKANSYALTTAPGRGLFGNHRKYESMSASASRGTGHVVESYTNWVGANRGHALMLADVTQGAADKFERFDALYNSMAQVLSFGRTGRFDYLTLIGNLGIADIEPGKPYLDGATGPLRGARLLFGGATNSPLSVQDSSDAVVSLGSHTQIGMQTFEDAMCNWQKNPTVFVPFRG